MTPTTDPSPATSRLLNLAHAIDHMFLLIFATAVSSIALEFGFTRWEDLMPYSVGAAALFGFGSLPAGRLGDLWGRRNMMLVFYFGMGASALLAATVQNAWQMAAALTVLGAFSAIYHPVGIPMLVQHSKNPGLTIGFNGLIGNLGIALSAVVTGLLVKYFGWRMAFVVPGLFSIAVGVAFAMVAPQESEPPAKRTTKAATLPRAEMLRVIAVMIATAITSAIVFNTTTNGNQQLLTERLRGVVEDPATLGALLSLVYVVASFAQIIVGRAIDRYPLKRIFLIVVAMQAPFFALAAISDGWVMMLLQIGFMVSVFGAIPFTDAMLVRYVDDSMRSRVSGMRLTISFGFSSLAVWMLGPAVKAAGFQTLLLVLAGVGLVTVFIVMMLPDDRQHAQAAPAN